MLLKLINSFMARMIAIERILDESIESEDSHGFLTSMPVSSVIMVLIERKIIDEERIRLHELSEEKELNQKEVYTLHLSDYLLQKVPYAKNIYDSLSFDRDNENIRSDMPGVLYHLTKEVNRESITRPSHLIELKMEMVLISLCVTLESFIQGLLKDFFTKVWRGNLLDSKQLTFKEINELTSIESAKEYIVDTYIESMFRKKFSDWFNEASGSLRVLDDFPDLTKVICELAEMYDRRNCHVHADGIANRIYLSKVPSHYADTICEGDKLDISEDYLREKIQQVENCAWTTFYSYAFKRFKDPGEAFSIINANMLEFLHRDCDAFEWIYKELQSHSKLSDEEKLLAKFNLCLYYKLTDKNEKMEKLLSDFNPRIYSVQYRMAKAILLEEESALNLVKEYFGSLDDTNFMLSYDWKLTSIIKNKPPFREFFRERIVRILDSYVLEGEENNGSKEETGEKEDNLPDGQTDC